MSCLYSLRRCICMFISKILCLPFTILARRSILTEFLYLRMGWTFFSSAIFYRRRIISNRPPVTGGTGINKHAHALFVQFSGVELAHALPRTCLPACALPPTCPLLLPLPCLYSPMSILLSLCVWLCHVMCYVCVSTADFAHTAPQLSRLDGEWSFALYYLPCCSSHSPSIHCYSTFTGPSSFWDGAAEATEKKKKKKERGKAGKNR